MVRREQEAEAPWPGSRWEAGRDSTRQEHSLEFYNPEEKGGHSLGVDRKLVSLIKTE